MGRNDILQTINDILKEILDDDSISCNETCKLEEIPEWDSVELMTLIATLENEFGVSLDFVEIMKSDTIGDLVGALEKVIK